MKDEVLALSDKESVRRVLDDLIDYTMSHFAFEESLQEEAGYKYAKPHKKSMICLFVA